MRTESLAQKKSKALHWIKTYRRRMAALKTSSKSKKQSLREKYRLALMQDKIDHWKRMIKTWDENDTVKPPASRILYFCEKYFTKEQFQLSSIKKENRVAVICFSKYCCENRLSNKEMWAAVGVHQKTFTDRRNKYTPAQMGDFYRRFKKYMDDCISKEREVRKNRKSTAAKRGPRKNKSAQEIGKAVRSAILQHESEILH